jgi:hypothetical protein
MTNVDVLGRDKSYLKRNADFQKTKQKPSMRLTPVLSSP